MEEVWKDICGYEGHYQVSNYGQIKNVKTNKILTGDINNIGYRRVCLCSPVKKRYFVHRIVAYHFCDGYNERLVVNHIDGNKQNNHADNLEWVTRSENDIHAFNMGLRDVYPCQFKHKIRAYDKDTMEFVREYENVQECVEDLHVARPNIYSCCNGKQKSCRGYVLRYAS